MSTLSRTKDRKLYVYPTRYKLDYLRPLNGVDTVLGPSLEYCIAQCTVRRHSLVAALYLFYPASRLESVPRSRCSLTALHDDTAVAIAIDIITAQTSMYVIQR
jgi:hypothetical protein